MKSFQGFHGLNQKLYHETSSIPKLPRKAWVAKKNSSLFNYIAPVSALIFFKSRNSSGASRSNIEPHVSMQSSYVFTTTHQLLGSLWRTTFQHGVLGSFQKNACWTCEGKTKGSSNSCNKCLKFARRLTLSQPHFWKSVRMTLTLPKWGLGSPSRVPKN